MSIEDNVKFKSREQITESLRTQSGTFREPT